jgi:hypothetical protein
MVEDVCVSYERMCCESMAHRLLYGNVGAWRRWLVLRVFVLPA